MAVDSTSEHVILVCLITGEFGVVYKGHIVKDEVVTDVVAVKTLKGKVI